MLAMLKLCLDVCRVRKVFLTVYFFSPMSMRAFACCFVMKLLISFAVVGEKLFSSFYFLLSFSGLVFDAFSAWTLKRF